MVGGNKGYIPSPFRRDQIWFVGKGQRGATDLYSLAEIKLPKGTKVRNDAAFEPNYIPGRYGAVPFLADLADVAKEVVGGEANKAE